MSEYKQMVLAWGRPCSEFDRTCKKCRAWRGFMERLDADPVEIQNQVELLYGDTEVGIKMLEYLSTSAQA